MRCSSFGTSIVARPSLMGPVCLILFGLCGLTARAADLDGDADVDLADWIRFQACFSGSGVQPPVGCEAADFDDDGDVDLADALAFVARFTGPNGTLIRDHLPDVMLNEVSFVPPPDESQFVELLLTADEVDLAGLYLENEAGDTYTLPGNIALANTGDIVLVVFDNEDRIDGATIHANLASFVEAESDVLSLRNPDGGLLSQITWGPGRPGDVPLNQGGLNTIPEAGSTLARRPQALSTSSAAWVAVRPNEASPGAENPNPGVTILRPGNGAIVPPGPLLLSWYAVQDARGYRVELATDEDFADVIVDQTVTDAFIITPPVGPGTYFWRVEALFEEGGSSAVSEAHTLFVRTPGGGGEITTISLDSSSLGGSFPSFSQHKDTNMILLESNRQDEGHRYDQAHAVLDSNDRADFGNCANASVAMINHYYGGGLSQDRIGYEVKNARAPGAEWDLNAGEGMTLSEVEAAMSFALGGASIVHSVVPDFQTSPTRRDEVWADLTTEIDAGRPVLLGIPGHALVLVGYQVQRGGGAMERRLIIHDPWNVGSGVAFRRHVAFDLYNLNLYCRSPSGAVLANIPSDEPAIAMDSDGDGINDFDEQLRFHTEWQLPGNDAGWDTDRDCAGDKDEIHDSMFDPDHGYAMWVNGAGGDGTARDSAPYDDFDSDDTIRPERDNDSDNGGLPDFMEDLNGNGRIDVGLGESDPFDPSDDARTIDGTRMFQFDININNVTTGFRRLDTEWSLRVQPGSASENGKVTGTLTATYNQESTTNASAAPPQCPQPRVIERKVQEIMTTFNVEGEFRCVETPSGDPRTPFARQTPMLILWYPPDGSRSSRPFPNSTTQTITDPCLGNQTLPFTPTIQMLPGTFGGVGTDTSGSGPGRIVWRVPDVELTISQ